MCCSPIEINTKSRFVTEGSPLVLTVPCGKCVECRSRRYNEYIYRCYYQSKETFASGGYMLFDTLTYDNEHLPHISDVDCLSGYVDKGSEYDCSCFCRDDVRLFMVRLRRHLSYLGYDVKDKLKYFLCSEYGTSESGTKRPHYHVIFYVYENVVPWDLLSLSIYNCWKKGRTDGLPFKSRRYVMSKRLFSSSSDVRHSFYVSRYVAKYVLKDFRYISKVSRYRSLLLFNNIRSYEYTRICKLVDRSVLPFHYQSQGFGIFALKDIDVDSVIRTGLVTYRAYGDSSVTSLQIPFYYYRKLFQSKEVIDGVTFYTDNDKGISYKTARLRYSLSSIFNSLNSFRLTVSQSDREKLDAVLSPSRYRDYVDYLLFRRYRINPTYSYSPLSLSDKLSSNNLLFNYYTNKDKVALNIANQTLSFEYSGSSAGGYFPDSFLGISFNLLKNSCYSNPLFERFREIFSQLREKYSVAKSTLFEHRLTVRYS